MRPFVEFIWPLVLATWTRLNSSHSCIDQRMLNFADGSFTFSPIPASVHCAALIWSFSGSETAGPWCLHASGVRRSANRHPSRANVGHLPPPWTLNCLPRKSSRTLTLNPNSNRNAKQYPITLNTKGQMYALTF